MKLHKPEEVETFTVQVTEIRYPKLFAAMVDEQVLSGLSVAEARREVEGRKVELELYYSPGLALFGLESEALELGANVIDPFSGNPIEASDE
jgi:hypothetical protein